MERTNKLVVLAWSAFLCLLLLVGVQFVRGISRQQQVEEHLSRQREAMANLQHLFKNNTDHVFDYNKLLVDVLERPEQSSGTLKEYEKTAKNRINIMDQRVKMFPESERASHVNEWAELTRAWREWRSHNENILGLLQTRVADSAQVAADAVLQDLSRQTPVLYAASDRLDKAVTGLVQVNVGAVDAAVASSQSGMGWSVVEGAVLVGAAVLLFAVTMSVLLKPPALRTFGQAHQLLLRVATGPELPERPKDEIIQAIKTLDNLFGKLSKSAESIQVRMRDIDGGIHALAAGTKRIVVDQINLYNLNTSVESARQQIDGFSVVTGEIRSLAENSQKSSDNIYQLSERLQSSTREVLAELDWVIQQLADCATSGYGDRQDVLDSVLEADNGVDDITELVREIASALHVDPVRIMAGLVQLQAASEIASAVKDA